MRSIASSTKEEYRDAAYVFGVDIDITEQKRADERFRLAIEAAPTGMLLQDASGKIVMVNAQVEKLFGYFSRRAVGTTGRDISSGAPPKRSTPIFAGHWLLANPKARAMGAGRDLYGLRKDGESQVPIEIRLNPLQTSEGYFVLSSIADITERKQVSTEHFRPRAGSGSNRHAHARQYRNDHACECTD